jgi:hypothetical protein
MPFIRTSRCGDVLSVGPYGPPAANGLINVVRVELAPGVAIDLDRLERHFYTSSSCGVCGKSSLDAVAAQSRYDLHDAGFKIVAMMAGCPLLAASAPRLRWPSSLRTSSA